MRLYKRFLIVSALFLSCATAVVAQKSEKKALTPEQIVGKMPEDIVNQLPMATGWADKNTVTLAQREGRDYKFFS